MASSVKRFGSAPVPSAWCSRKYDVSRGDVLHPLAEGREVQRDHVQPVVEVAPEIAAADLFLEIAVRRGNNAHVDAHCLGGPHGDDLSLLQYTQ